MARIVLVEDERNIRNLYTVELTEEGHEVIVAENGSALLEKVRKGAPDLIILGVKMANEETADILQCLNLLFPDMPVILTAGHPSFQRDHTSPHRYYVQKTSDLASLKWIIVEALGSPPLCPAETPQI